MIILNKRKPMSTAGKLKRYALILEKIQKSKYPSFKEIDQFLNRSSIDISDRTLQRYIEQIKYQFDINIEYDKKRNGYYLEESDRSKSMISFIQSQSMAVNFLTFIKDHPGQADAVIVSDDVNGKGIEYIEPVLYAISNNRIIEFTYQKFLDDTVRSFTMQPYGLKEFQNRWYLVGVLKGMETISTFGTDRVQSLNVTTQKFTRNKNIDIKAHFAQMIGIHSGEGESEIMRLSFSVLQAQYIKSVPLHNSQKMITGNDQEIVFEYVLIQNYELLQKIMSYGAEVKVLKPLSLQKWHKETLKRTLMNYK
jgi:predicted DNA-binding transcriptional regulator YafY